MTETELFVINFLICIGFGVVGFLVRLTLEAWRDYHVQKALYEAHLQENNPVRRYRRAQHRKRMVPRDVLDRFQQALKRRKKAVMVCESGRWRNAA